MKVIFVTFTKLAQMKISNKVALITGGANGIGRALCLQMLESGARVAIADLSEEGLEQTWSLAADHAHELKCYQCDLSDQKAVEDLKSKVLDEFRGLDILINNAGMIQPFTRFKDLKIETITKIINVDFYSAIYVTRAFYPALEKSSEAKILNVSSMGGFLPVPGQAIYGAAKAALKLFTEALQAETMGTNISVSIVFPGAVKTDIVKNSGVEAPVSDSAQKEYKALDVNRAAEIIINGIKRNKKRIFVGSDSRMMDILYRIHPNFAIRLIQKQMKDLLK